MEKQQKQEQIDMLKGIFANAESIVLAGIEGLNAGDIAKLRRGMHESGVNFKVFKNTLARIATQGLPAESLNDDFVGSTAIAWSEDDAVLPAKTAFKFNNLEAFKIKAGLSSGSRVDFDKLMALSKLPGLEDLRAQLLGLIQGVHAKLLAQVQAPASHVVGVIHAKSEKDKDVN